MITVKIEENITKLLARAEKRFERLATLYEKKLATSTMLDVKNGIYQQTLGLAPRSKKTKSADPRTLIDTEDYLRSIRVKGATISMDGRKMRLAEFGPDRTHPRPHWRPVTTIRSLSRPW